MVVRILNVLIDFLDQFLDAAKRPATDSLLGDAVDRYVGVNFVQYTGEHRAVVPQDVVENLVAYLLRANYFAFKDSYENVPRPQGKDVDNHRPSHCYYVFAGWNCEKIRARLRIRSTTFERA